ncbi:MAG: allantoinase AllB [Acidobacteria bacterium]|nr:MAG: allantoinase AllB [Acidobacteriota bacterium]
MRQRFVNLRIPDHGNDVREAEILVDGGRIVALAAPADGDGGDEERIDLGGALVLPGVIDGHVHFDDPGFTHRETFASGTRAAAAGGVSCVVDMPCTTLPPVTRGSALDNKLSVIRPKAHVDFMLWGGVCENSMAEPDWREHLREIAEAGVGSIKVYMLSGMDTFRDLGREQLRAVLAEAARLGVPVGVHAEDRELVHALTERLRSAGRERPLDYAASRPAEAEINAVATMRQLCRETGARVHIVHVGTGRALDLIAGAKEEGLPMSGETCPHFLAFTDEDLAAQGAVLKTAPVVKSAADQKRLWQGVASGELDYVATDHAAGQWPEEKHTGSIWTDYGGVPGVELMLPYLYSEGVRKGRITLERLVEVTASAPARFFGIERRKGRLAPGLDADLVVFDPDETWTVRAGELHNLNRYTPHEGQLLTGRVRALYVRGRLAYQRRAGGEHFAPPGTGEWVRRESRC